MLVMRKGSYPANPDDLGKIMSPHLCLIGKCPIRKMGIILRMIIVSLAVRTRPQKVLSPQAWSEQEPRRLDPTASVVNHRAPSFHFLGLPRTFESEPLSRKGIAYKSLGTWVSTSEKPKPTSGFRAWLTWVDRVANNNTGGNSKKQACGGLGNKSRST